MWVLGLSCFTILSTTCSPCAIGLKYTLVPPNMSNQDSITWDYIDIILNNTLRALYHLLLHLDGTNMIPKELSEFIGRNATKSNAYGNETQTITKVEETSHLKQHFGNLTRYLGDAKKEGGNLWWFLIIVNFDRYNSYTIGGVKKQRTGRLTS